jgi:beta-lactamase class A
MFLATFLAAAQTPDGLADLDHIHKGRLGVAILNTGNGRRLAHRGDERFPMCSTFKFLLAACVLARADQGRETLTHRIVVAQRDLLPHAPVTSLHVGGPGMTLHALCEAVMTESDNTAANLLLGDTVTRLDRIELALNDVGPGDPRDTTTPNAMLENLRKIVLGGALTPASRAAMIAWLIGCKTGDNRLRAGLPRGWRIGDKTGTGPDINNAVNDIAVIWPPRRAPVIVTAYYAFSRAPLPARESVLAKVAARAVKI